MPMKGSERAAESAAASIEIILETPQSPPTFLKECAFVIALKTILDEYRKFIAYAPNCDDKI